MWHGILGGVLGLGNAKSGKDSSPLTTDEVSENVSADDDWVEGSGHAADADRESNACNKDLVE